MNAVLHPMDARALVSAMREQTSATRALSEVVQSLIDELALLRGVVRERPERFAEGGAMGVNAR